MVWEEEEINQEFKKVMKLKELILILEEIEILSNLKNHTTKIHSFFDLIWLRYEYLSLTLFLHLSIATYFLVEFRLRN